MHPHTTTSILSIRFTARAAVALLYGGGHAVVSRRVGEGIVGMAEWDGAVLHRTAAGTVYLRWPNDYLPVRQPDGAGER